MPVTLFSAVVASALLMQEPQTGTRFRIDNFVTAPDPAGGRVVSVAPTLWWNDASDATVGLRVRSDRAGSERVQVWVMRGMGGIRNATLGDAVDFGVLVRRGRFAAQGWAREGTVGARLARTDAPAAGSGNHRTTWDAAWVATRETAFLDPGQWDNAGTVEVGVDRRWTRQNRAVRSFRVGARVGVAYQRNRDIFSAATYSSDPFLRVTTEAVWARNVAGFELAVRGFAGGYLADDNPFQQRAITVAGADPYERLGNPLLRTQGAPLAGPDVFYHAPGNLNMRGFRPGDGGRWGASANIEVRRSFLERSAGVFRGVSVVGFWDAAVVDTMAVVSFSNRSVKPLHDGGFGVRARFAVGDITFPLRIEFPIYVSSPFVAHNRKQGDEFVEFRWLVSLQPIF